MAIRNFHWSSVFDCVMHETDGAAATIATYTHEPEQFGPLLSETRGGAGAYHHFDALGATNFLTNDSGMVSDTFQYDAWGNVIARVGTTATPYQWVGKFGYQHETQMGNYYIRARTYQSSIGRWLAVDPLFPLPVMQKYIYCLATPAVLIDPSGLAPKIRWENECTRYLYSPVRLECHCGDTVEVALTINISAQLGVLWNVIKESVEASFALQVEAGVSCNAQCAEQGSGPGEKVSRCRARICWQKKQVYKYVDVTPYDMPFWWLITGRIHEWLWVDTGNTKDYTLDVGIHTDSNTLSCC